jgi:hypothetical protein
MNSPTRLQHNSTDGLLGSQLAPHVDAFTRHLTERRYASGTIDSYLACVAHIARWTVRCRLDIHGIDEDVVRRFLDDHLPRCNCAYPVRKTHHDLRAALRHLLVVLRANSVIAEHLLVITPAVEELRRFDDLVQRRRDGNAAKRFFRRLLKGLQYVPRVIVTDKLQSYGVAHRQLLPKVEHRQSRYLNNRAENSHRPTRRRERQMQRFKSPRQAQEFLSAPAFIHGHFHPRRHLLTANSYREIRTEAFKTWQHETGVQIVARPTRHIRTWRYATIPKLT